MLEKAVGQLGDREHVDEVEEELEERDPMGVVSGCPNEAGLLGGHVADDIRSAPPSRSLGTRRLDESALAAAGCSHGIYH